MAMTIAAHELLFSIHGVEIRFLTESPSVANAVEDLLYAFRCTAFCDVPMTMQFEAAACPADIPMRLPADARRLFGSSGLTVGTGRRMTWRCDVYEARGLILADFHEEGMVVIDGAKRHVQGYVVRPDDMTADIRASFVHFGVTELLKRRGLYTFHATALEKNGRGVLIPGFSGHGKTTSFLSLLRGGYRYLSDDHPFFRLSGGQVELLPFPLKVNVTDQTVAFFPELQQAPTSILRPGIPKRYFRVQDLYPAPLGDPCLPAVILFPEVVDSAHSCLEPLSKKQALQIILPHALLVYDADIARREFQALTRLVEQADAYRLHFGRDVLELPWLVTPLLERTGKGEI